MAKFEYEQTGSGEPLVLLPVCSRLSLAQTLLSSDPTFFLSPMRFVLFVFTVSCVAFLGWRLGWIQFGSQGSPQSMEARVAEILRQVEVTKRAQGVREMNDFRTVATSAKSSPPVVDFFHYGTVGKFVDPVLNDIEAYKRETSAELERNAFEALDKRAEQALKGKLRFGNGEWKLGNFYRTLSEFDQKSELAAHARLRHLNAWVEARPKSMAARIALADFYVQFGWAARGNGWANTVTEAGWKLLNERLNKSADILKQARTLGVHDPHYWYVYQWIAIGIGDSRPVLDEVFRQGIAIEPQYWPLYASRAISLLPRWYGKPGEMEKFADEAARIPGGLGLEAYARIAMEVRSYHQNLFTETTLDWEKVRQGCGLLRKKYPDSMELLSLSAQLAAFGGDRVSTLGWLEELGDHLDVRTWTSQERYNAFLYKGGPVCIIEAKR